MKKLIILTAILSLILAGCGRGGEVVTDVINNNIDHEQSIVQAEELIDTFNHEQFEEDNNNYNFIINNSVSITDCNVIKDELMLTRCQDEVSINVVLDSGNISDCEQLSTLEMQEECTIRFEDLTY